MISQEELSWRLVGIGRIYKVVRLKVMQDNNESIVLSPDYVDVNVSIKVVKIIQSYRKIINKMIWIKEQ